MALTQHLSAQLIQMLGQAIKNFHASVASVMLGSGVRKHVESWGLGPRKILIFTAYAAHFSTNS